MPLHMLPPEILDRILTLPTCDVTFHASTWDYDSGGGIIGETTQRNYCSFRVYHLQEGSSGWCCRVPGRIGHDLTIEWQEQSFVVGRWRSARAPRWLLLHGASRFFTRCNPELTGFHLVIPRSCAGLDTTLLRLEAAISGVRRDPLN